MEINKAKLAEEYLNGKSFHELAREYGTYPTTIRRWLTDVGTVLRHDRSEKDTPYVQNGEKLIEWAKAQGRLVTKQELAAYLGKARLSPSYFIKYCIHARYILNYSSAHRQMHSKLNNFQQSLYSGCLLYTMTGLFVC